MAGYLNPQDDVSAVITAQNEFFVRVFSFADVRVVPCEQHVWSREELLGFARFSVSRYHFLLLLNTCNVNSLDKSVSSPTRHSQWSHAGGLARGKVACPVGASSKGPVRIRPSDSRISMS